MTNISYLKVFYFSQHFCVEGSRAQYFGELVATASSICARVCACVHIRGQLQVKKGRGAGALLCPLPCPLGEGGNFVHRCPW